MGLMDAFNMGVQGGQVSSAAYGPGQAIRGLLDTAKKKGLIREQGMMTMLPSVGKALQPSFLKKFGPIPDDAGHMTIDPTTNKGILKNYNQNDDAGWVPRYSSPSLTEEELNMLENRKYKARLNTVPEGVDPGKWAAANDDQKESYLTQMGL